MLKRRYTVDSIIQEYKKKKKYKEKTEIQEFQKKYCSNCKNQKTYKCEIRRDINGNLNCINNEV